MTEEQRETSSELFPVAALFQNYHWPTDLWAAETSHWGSWFTKVVLIFFPDNLFKFIIEEKCPQQD